VCVKMFPVFFCFTSKMGLLCTKKLGVLGNICLFVFLSCTEMGFCCTDIEESGVWEG